MYAAGHPRLYCSSVRDPGHRLFMRKGELAHRGLQHSQEEKACFDEKALCRVMGGLMFALAACFVVMALSEVFQMIAFLWGGLALLIVVTVVGVTYMNTSKKVKRK